MTFKTHYEAVPVSEKPEESRWCMLTNSHGRLLIAFYDGYSGWRYDDPDLTHWLRPRPDTVLLTREEVETLRDELPWVSADVPPMTNGYYICWCCNPQEQGLIHYHVDTGWQNGFYNERVTHYIPISKPTSITNSNE